MDSRLNKTKAGPGKISHSNHLHVVLRNRPDVVQEWSDDEVARRWLRLYPKRRDSAGRNRKRRSSIPAHLVPILERIGIDSNGWCDLMKKFGKLFKRAAGIADTLANDALRRGITYMHGPGDVPIARVADRHTAIS